MFFALWLWYRFAGLAGRSGYISFPSVPPQFFDFICTTVGFCGDVSAEKGYIFVSLGLEVFVEGYYCWIGLERFWE